MRFLILMILCVTASSGCGTVNNVFIVKNGMSYPEKPPMLVYGGVRSDLAAIKSNAQGLNVFSDTEVSPIKSAGGLLVSIVDTPFSLVGDTIFFRGTYLAEYSRSLAEHYLDNEALEDLENQPELRETQINTPVDD